VELGLQRPEAAFALLESYHSSGHGSDHGTRHDSDHGYEALDPGTLLLAFSLGEAGSHLFVLDAEGALEVHELLPSAATLGRQVRLFRRWLTALEGEALEEARKNLEEMGERLYGSLLGPAAARMEENYRLLILPDGPLHFLPFGDLIRRGEDGVPQNLASWKSVHTVSSSTALELFGEWEVGVAGGGGGSCR
jgi:hypothetical protein